MVYKVTGSGDINNPGAAPFWSEIQWVNLSLTANIPNAPTSGLTHYILVKAAWNGSWIFILVKWYAPEPAFGAWKLYISIYSYISICLIHRKSFYYRHFIMS
jgi:cytochrome b558/566 subunit A